MDGTTVFFQGLFVIGLVVAAIIDLKTRRIPNWLILLMLLNWLIYLVVIEVVVGTKQFASLVVAGMQGCLLLGGGTLLLSLAYEKLFKLYSMGGGDIKLLGIIGLYLSWEKGLIALLIASLAALLIVLLAWFRPSTSFPPINLPKVFQNPHSRESLETLQAIPFGPALAFGTITALIFF